MMHISTALGVNCTYCHNTRAFYSWEESTPQRVTAWYGIRMVRDINNNYIGPLAPLYADVPGTDNSVRITRRMFIHKSLYTGIAAGAAGAAVTGWFPIINTITYAHAAGTPALCLRLDLGHASLPKKPEQPLRR